MIAILASFLTYYLTLRQQNNKEKQNYNGLLYTLHTELYWHSHHLHLLKNTIKLLAEALIKKDFILKKPLIEIDIALTNQILLQLIDYKGYNYDLITLLTSYNNQIKSLNYFLDFNSASEFLKLIKDDEKDVKSYFESLENQYINKTQTTIIESQKILQVPNHPEN